MNSFEDTIKTQEKVISRMQSVLETQLASRSNNLGSSIGGLSRSMPPKQGDLEAANSVTSPRIQVNCY